jgi:hypothetical protein
VSLPSRHSRSVRARRGQGWARVRAVLDKLGQIGVLSGALVGAACVDPDKPQPKFRLEGSLTQVMDLGYDEARILLAPEDVSVTFVRKLPLGSGLLEDGGMVEVASSENYPVKVSYRFAGEALDGGRMDLASRDETGAQRGDVSRNVQNDPRATFPPLLRGTLFLKQPLVANALVDGDFHVTFDNGIEAASGRTVFSTSFQARVQP